MDRNAKLSPHFKLSEFVRDVDPLPPPAILANLKRLAEALEGVRSKLGGKPITITSGYRTQRHNAEVGGSKGSFHLTGLAADIVVGGLSAREVQKLLADWPGGMGSYAGWTHLDIRPYKARWKQ